MFDEYVPDVMFSFEGEVYAVPLEPFSERKYIVIRDPDLKIFVLQVSWDRTTSPPTIVRVYQKGNPLSDRPITKVTRNDGVFAYNIRRISGRKNVHDATVMQSTER